MRTHTKDLTLCALFTALAAVLSQVSLPLPFTPVPITLSTVAVFLTGALLTPRQAFTSWLCYLLLGAVGVPVFAGFSGGISVLLGPTGGYLMVFPFMAALIAWVFTRGQSLPRALAGIGLSLLLCYAGGCAWFMLITGQPLQTALALTVLPFLPMDVAKAAACAVLALPLRRSLARAAILQ